MNAVLKTLNINHFNTTEDPACFNDPEIGALFLGADENFQEIDQQILKDAVEKNQDIPMDGYDINVLECFPEELFIEESFSSIGEAEEFIESFFSNFPAIESKYCSNIMTKLRLFAKLKPLKKKLNCRFEIVSGNSCRKFHIDTVGARLIYTCAGPGTQLKHPDRKLYITLPSGSALIVKGSKYPDFKTVTLHRSPSVQGLGIKRFLFIADYQ